MRAAPNEIKLCNLLLEIGKGVQYGRMSDVFNVPKENQANNLDEIIDFCFPAELFANPLEHSQFVCDAALLCPRNEDVEHINNIAIERMSGQTHIFESIDTPRKQASWIKERNNTFYADANIETIHKETPTGLPPHILKLKVSF